MATIEINNLSKYYGQFHALKDINLSVQKGDFFGFIGPNGAGKSTTIRILLGLLRKSSGDVTVCGYPAKPNQKKILKQVGYVPSEANFYNGLTAKEIINFSAKLYPNTDKDETQRLCRLFEIPLEKKVEELSFGNRRKISLVTAMQHHPNLLILDEPTSGLDPLMQKKFWDELKTRNEQGVTMFVSSHNLNEVQKYCRQAAIIREGEIVQQGTITELMETTAKRVRIHGMNQVPALDGDIRNIITENQSVNFLYQGSIDVLLQTLNHHLDQILDIEITNPDLEEVFLHYYDNNREVELNENFSERL